MDDNLRIKRVAAEIANEILDHAERGQIPIVVIYSTPPKFETAEISCPTGMDAGMVFSLIAGSLLAQLKQKP